MVRCCAQVKIAEAGALELLLTMVPSSSLETRRQIARALANLSVNQANKDRLAELDGVSGLQVTCRHRLPSLSCVCGHLVTIILPSCGARSDGSA